MRVPVGRMLWRCVKSGRGRLARLTNGEVLRDLRKERDVSKRVELQDERDVEAGNVPGCRTATYERTDGSAVRARRVEKQVSKVMCLLSVSSCSRYGHGWGRGSTDERCYRDRKRGAHRGIHIQRLL